jgi:hypothetical protein
MSQSVGSGRIDIYTVGEYVDKAILYFAHKKPIGKLALQKGIFLFLLSVSNKRNYDFMKVASLAGFEPYKLGPFSEFIEGELDMLKGYGKISTVGAQENSMVESKVDPRTEYSFGKEETEILDDISLLLNRLDPKELAFYVYYHPAINKEIRKYFTTNSELKPEFEQNKRRFVDKLLRKGILDDDAATLILYGDS